MPAGNNMRTALAALGCLTLAACSTGVDPSIPPYVPPSMPTTEAAGKGIKQAAVDAHLTAPIEMSDLRKTDHGPGSFTVCIRRVESKSNRIVTYAVFFDNNDYKGLRLPLILDACEKQSYRPFS
jgi:hypothetical protein